MERNLTRASTRKHATVNPVPGSGCMKNKIATIFFVVVPTTKCTADWSVNLSISILGSETKIQETRGDYVRELTIRPKRISGLPRTPTRVPIHLKQTARGALYSHSKKGAIKLEWGFQVD